MTIRVSFDGWVNDVKSFSWGHVLKMSHDRRSRDEQSGEWETTGKDYIDVVVNDEQLADIADEKLIHVEGTQRELRAYIKQTGEAGASQTLSATHVSALRRENAVVADTAPATFADEDAPF